MTSKATGFETGTAGSALTTGDTGDPDTPNEVAITAGGSATYSSTYAAHANLSVRLKNTTSGDKITVGFISFNSTTVCGSAYIRFQSYPSAASDLATIRNSTTNAMKVQIWSDGKLRVLNSAGTTVKTFASAIGTGSWIRLEWQATKGTTTSDGRIRVAYYALDDETAVDSYDSGTTTNTGTTNLVVAHLGMMTGTATGEFWVDCLQAVDTSGPLGPWASGSASSLSDQSTATDAGVTYFYVYTVAVDDTSDTTDYQDVTAPTTDPAAEFDVATVGTARVGGGVGWLYGLQEGSGSTTAGDVSGVPGRPKLTLGHQGTGGEADFGASGIMPEGTAMQLTPAGSGSGYQLYSSLPRSFTSTSFTFLCQFNWTGDTGVELFRVGNIADGIVSLEATPTGVTVLMRTLLGASVTATKEATTNDGRPHFVVLTAVGNEARLYVDEDPVAATAVPQGMGYVDGLTIGSPISADPLQIAWVGYLVGSMSAERVAELSALATGDAESSDARVGRIVRWVGGELEFEGEAGLSDVAYQATGGAQALDIIAEANKVEGGVFFATGDGRFRQHSRSHRYNAPVAATIPATLVNPGDLQIVLDTSRLVNDVTVSRPSGATYRARNEPSVSAYGEFSDEQTIYAATDTSLESAAGWLVRRYGDIAPHIPSVTLDLLTMDAATAAQVLSLEIGDRIQITGMPSQTPGGATVDLFVEGFSESVSASSWALTINTTPGGFGDVAVVGTSLVGTAPVAY